MPREVIQPVLPDEAKEVQTDLLLGREETARRRQPFPNGAIEPSFSHVHSLRSTAEEIVLENQLFERPTRIDNFSSL